MRAAITPACLACLCLSPALLPGAAGAQPCGQVLLYRDAGALHLLSDEEAGVPVQLRGLEPTWDWEGHGSYAVLCESPQGLSVDWFLDVAGTPDWERVTLAQGGDGLSVSVRHRDAEAQSTCYSSYAAMLDAGDGTAEMVGLLLRRLGQGPRVPELSTVRALVFGRPDPCDDALRRECLALVARLDSEDFRTREQASAQLAQPRRVGQLKRLAAGLDLSPEQECRVATILSAYALPQGADSLLPKLRALAFAGPRPPPPGGETVEARAGTEAALDDGE